MALDTPATFGPVPLPEESVPLDDELRGLQTALEIAAASVQEHPENAILLQLHRQATQRYQEALAARRLAIQ
ncbi:MAG: hypothetical protein PHX87_00725 [Candidatus Peribacteraceae bacterium]|nr:hypothetical protein [Candidatus Peribacteraceae bacterium]MDD5741932.1 hypothetical protein [Candidatus Peribacteraceae bacterium]